MKLTKGMRLRFAAGHLVDVLPVAVVRAAIVASTALSFAQRARSEAIAYCAELKELNNYAISGQRFAQIIGPPRSGNYNEAKLSLIGWTNCAFYGTRTYTCDSTEFKSQEEAAKAHQRIGQDILNCFGGTWAYASEQVSPDFVVLHPKLGPASITLNLGETDNKTHSHPLTEQPPGAWSRKTGRDEPRGTQQAAVAQDWLFFETCTRGGQYPNISE